MRALLGLCALAGLAWAPVSSIAAISVRYDNEYTWMRAGWQDTKLPLLVEDGLARGLSQHIAADESLLSSSMLGTVSGPAWRQVLQMVQASKQQAQRAPLEVIHTGAASKLLHCAVCGFLAQQLWDRAIEKLHAVLHTQPFALSDIEAHITMGPRAQGSCHHNTMHTFLLRHAIWQVDGNADGGGSDGDATQAPDFALCSRVAREKMQDEEVIAAARACEEVAEDVTASFSQREGSGLLTQYYQEYLQRKTVREGEIRKAAALLPECVDAHWNCGPWAIIGECDANPNYMVGSMAKRQPGNCLRSCGRCPNFDALTGIPLAERPWLHKLQADLRLQFEQLACQDSCKGEAQLRRGLHAACWPSASTLEHAGGTDEPASDAADA